MTHPLIGKGVMFNLNGKRSGIYCGIVRRVAMTTATKKKPAVIKSLIVQRPGGDLAVSGKSYSARCGGDRMRLQLDDLIGVSWYGKIRPVADFLKDN